MTTLQIVEILVRIAWLAGAVAFVIGLSRMNSPATARNGNLVSAGGMALAIGATAVLHPHRTAHRRRVQPHRLGRSSSSASCSAAASACTRRGP